MSFRYFTGSSLCRATFGCFGRSHIESSLQYWLKKAVKAALALSCLVTVAGVKGAVTASNPVGGKTVRGSYQIVELPWQSNGDAAIRLDYDVVSTNDGSQAFYNHAHYFIVINDAATNGTGTSLLGQGSIFVSGRPGSKVKITEIAVAYFNSPFVVQGSFFGSEEESSEYTFGTRWDVESDGPGHPRNPSSNGDPKNFVGDPVNVTTGAFYTNALDLKVDGPMPIEIRRTYSSLASAPSELGFGWQTGYSPYLVFSSPSDPSTITASDADGSVVVFRRQGAGDVWSPLPADNPGLDNGGGSSRNLFNSRIEKSVEGNAERFYWRFPDGSVRQYLVRSFPSHNGQGLAPAGAFGGRVTAITRTVKAADPAPGEPPVPPVVTYPQAPRLVRPINLEYLRQRPYLEKWTDHRGNFLNFDINSDPASVAFGRIVSIISSNGSSVSLEYNPGGVLKSARASDGRQVNYTVSSIGDLVAVQAPDGATTTYQYGTGALEHCLVAELKPGLLPLINTYDSQRRVIKQEAGVEVFLSNVATGNFSSRSAVNATFDYSVAGQTTLKDAYNQPTVYRYTDGLITQIVDPLGRTTTQAWHASTNPATGAYQRSLQTVTAARGLVTSYAYDAQGNIVQTQLVGDIDGDTSTNETVTTTASYNLLNQPLTSTDASGITTTYTYADANFPYLPTQVTRSKTGATIRTDKFEYANQADATTPAAQFSRGLLVRQTVALGTADEAVTEYAYNAAGFLTQEKAFPGTSDPAVTVTYIRNARGEVVSATDGDGRSTHYTYDGLSRTLTKVVKDESGATLGTWTTSYTGTGLVAQTAGPRAGPVNTVLKSYDGAGRILREEDARSRAKSDGSGVEPTTATVTTYFHDLFGNLTLLRKTGRPDTLFTYDAVGQLRSKTVRNSTSGVASVEQFQYEPGGEVSDYTNPLGGVTRKFYTSLGKPRRQENPDGSVLEWRYFSDGRLQRETLRNGTYREFAYDDVARVTSQTLRKPNGDALATESGEYDRRGNETRRTDAEGFVKAVAYDGLNRAKISTGPAAVVGSARQITTLTYGASAKTLTVQNALGETVVTTSDGLGRPVLLQVKSADGTAVRSTSYAYSADHQSVTVTEGAGPGAITTITFTDLAGRVVLTKTGDGKFVRNVYDSLGNLTSTTDQLNQTTAYTYNALDQAISQTLPDGTVTTFVYNAAGGLLSRGMAGGALTHEQTYDNAGRKLTEQLYSGSETTRQFSYTYYPSNSPWAGLLQTTTAPRHTSTVAYDDFLRPQTLTTAGALPETNGVTTLGYDKRGLATSIVQNSVADAAGPATAITRTFDGHGQLLTETVTAGSQTYATIVQTWDAAGRRSSLNEAGSTLPGALFAYQYRADGKMTQVASNGQSYGFTFASNGLLTGRSNPFRTLTVDSRDATGRVLQQTNTVAGAAALVEMMAWRANSTLASYGAARSGAGAWNETRAYAYDSRGQLLSEGFSPAVGQSSAITYAFDGSTTKLGIRTDAKVGTGAPVSWQSKAAQINSLGRVTQDRVGAGGKPVSVSGISLGADRVEVVVDNEPQGRATHPGPADPVGAWSMNLNLTAGSHTLLANSIHPSGQFTATASSTFTVAGASSGLSGNVTHAYDGDGNVVSRTWTSGTTQTLSWDALGRLVKIAQRNGANTGYDWTAVYDGFGRRLKTSRQTITAGAADGAPTATTSIYDPQVEFLEIGVAVNGAKAWKVYGPDLNGDFGSLQGTGGLEATITDADRATSGVIGDQFGNGVAAVTAGNLNWFATRVGSYGPLPGSEVQTLTEVSKLAESTAWRGRRVDATGFIFLGARYYEPNTGRFLSADPMGHGASMSLYDYCNGDPVNSFDPDGRYGKEPWKNPYPAPNRTAVSITNPNIASNGPKIGQTVKGALGIMAAVGFTGIAAVATAPVVIVVAATGAVVTGALGLTNFLIGATGIGPSNVPAGPFGLTGFAIDRAVSPAPSPNIIGPSQQIGDYGDMASRAASGAYRLDKTLDKMTNTHVPPPSPIKPPPSGR